MKFSNDRSQVAVAGLASHKTGSAPDLQDTACFTIFDIDHHTESLPTLNAFLDYSLSLIETAEYLNVHVNTLKYRIRKIRELTGIQEFRGTEAFYLQLSILLLKSAKWSLHSIIGTAASLCKQAR